MARITQEMVEKSYEVAKQVHNRKFDKNRGINILNKQYGMNRYSASIYVNDIICMLNGQRYKLQMAEDHTEYFLTMIEKEFGIEYLKIALSAVKQHINYEHSIEHPCNVEKLYISFMQKLGGGEPKQEKRRETMKIEIGESLMLSYLKHIKKCLFYQANWKVSSNWHIDDISSDKVLFSYSNIIKHPEFSDIFKASKLEQLIKQIDRIFYNYWNYQHNNQ